MQLDVLSGSIQKLQKSVGDLVFADALISDQKQVFAQFEVPQHVFQHSHVLEITKNYIQININYYKIEETSWLS